jgi:hypothetical protein
VKRSTLASQVSDQNLSLSLSLSLSPPRHDNSDADGHESAHTDLAYALRWSIALAVVASTYAISVRSGAIPDVISQWTASFSKTYLFGATAIPQ